MQENQDKQENQETQQAQQNEQRENLENKPSECAQDNLPKPQKLQKPQTLQEWKDKFFKKRPKVQKTQKQQKTIRAFWAIVIAVASFMVGAFSCWLWIGPEFRTLITTKKYIDYFYYDDIDDSQFFGVIYDAINGEVLDNYSYYMTTDEYQEYTTAGEGKRSGIGLVFTTRNDGDAEMRIVRVCGNSPAEKADIKAGEYVVGFGADESSIMDSTVFQDFSDFLGDYDTSEIFYIKIQSGVGADAEIRIVPIAKEAYVENYVFYRTAETAYRFEGKDALTLVEKGNALPCLDAQTAYIHLTEFNGEASAEFIKAMKQFRADGMKNLVLDLRGNGGGYLRIMQDIAAYFCKNSKDKKPLVAVADYGKQKQGFRASGNYYWDYFDADSRICVLADNESASASECLIGSMIDYGAISYADICLTERSGEIKTFGKGIMQSTYPLVFGGGAVKLTTAVIRWPVSNHCIHGRGVLPEDGALYISEIGNFDMEIAASIEKLFS